MRDSPFPAPFVVGVGRSGTTLLRLMLDAHPDLSIPPETHFLPELIGLFEDGRQPDAKALARAVKTHPGWRDFGLSEPELEAAFEMAEPGPADAIRAFFGTYASRHGKPRWGDKTPVYMEAMGLIGSVLEEARFVHLIRDGRDVAVSRRARAAARGREPTPAANEAETWRRRIQNARREASSLSHYREWRYEDLVSDAPQVLGEICEFTALAFDPGMLHYHEGAASRLGELADIPGKRGKVRPRTERIAAHALTSEPPRGDRLGRWRTEFEPDEIAAYEGVAGDLLRELGYEVSG